MYFGSGFNCFNDVCVCFWGVGFNSFKLCFFNVCFNLLAILVRAERQDIRCVKHTKIKQKCNTLEIISQHLSAGGYCSFISVPSKEYGDA